MTSVGCQGVVRFVLAMLMFVIASAGCTSLGGSSPCVDDDTQRRMKAALERFETADIGEEPMTMVFDGRMDGENSDITIAVSPAQKALRLSIPDMEIRVKGNEYSYEDLSDDPDAIDVYGRNHRPNALYDEFLELANDDSEDSTEFLNEVAFEDYTISCTESNGVQLAELSYEDEDSEERLVVERSGQFRPVQGIVRDDISDDNFRVSISYQEPTIKVDTTLQRVPLTVALESASAFENARGGVIETMIVTDGTEWAPLSQLTVQLTDGESVYREDALRAGNFDWDDGDTFRFDDRDGNGLLSDGDRMTYDLGPGLFVGLWDSWAGASAAVENT